MKILYNEVEARALAQEEKKILVCGFEGWLDLDYYAVVTPEELRAKQAEIKDSLRSWISVMEDYTVHG